MSAIDGDERLVTARRRRGPVGLVLALAAGVACSCGGGARNVVLVTIDTLRADHVSSYGYARPTTPHLDALAQRGTRYLRALSSAPWTLPSHASLFTGLDPFEHGAVSIADARLAFNAHPLAREHLTLAEALRDEGFATGAFVANDVFLGRRSQLDQGFDTYEVHREPGMALDLRVASWLDAHRDGRFFLFVNYMDCHRPYNTRPVPGVVDPPASLDPRLLDILYEDVMSGDGVPPPDLVARVVAQYDTGIANADSALGALLGRLRDLGLEGETLVIVTSDHGEYFGEHGLVEHSKDVYQPAVHVPLVVAGPGRAPGQTDDRPLTSSGLVTVVLDGLEAPLRERVAARFPKRREEGLPLVENSYSRSRDLRSPIWGGRFRRVRRALYDWPLKYIHSSDGRHELYDLDADPGEASNLLGERRNDAERLEARLIARLSERPNVEAPEPPPLTDEEREHLRELGYSQ